MKFLIISDIFSLESWLIDGKDPEIMPAVYEFYNYLGNHSEHSFDAVIAHPSINKIVEFPNGSKIHICRLNVPFHYIRKFQSMGFLRREGEKLIHKGNNYTHIYGMTIYANVAQAIGIKYNIPSVGRLFGSLIWDVLQKGNLLKARTRFHYQLKEIKKPCDITICTEDGTEFDKAINKYSPDAEVHMLYNGINKKLRNNLLAIPAIDCIESTKKIRFCYIARLTYWKRQDLALDIVYKLKQKGIRISLDIYGKGETEKRLRAKIEKLSLKNEVKIMGSIPHSKMSTVLSQYHVAMFLYDASNLGNAMWEAALSGRLIFTRDTGKTANLFNQSNSVIMSGIDIDTAIDNFISILDKKLSLAHKSRKEIDGLLPNWITRFEQELSIISRL